MFVATRIANGVVALLALLISLMLLLGGGSAMRPASILLALVAVFFLIDVIWRKKVSTGDTVFTTLWTLLFAYAIFEGMIRFSVMYTEPMYAEPLGGVALVGVVMSLIYGVPFLLNSIYLFRLLKQKKSPA
jgi:hypothetical protein